MVDRKAILLNLPEEIFDVMKDFKKVSGMSYTNIMYNAITWWLTNKGLLDLSYIREKSKNGSLVSPEVDPLIEKIEK